MSTREQAIKKFLEELPASTGKSIEEWRMEIQRNAPPKYQDRVAWLRAKHNFQYRPACMVALQSGDNPADYTNSESLVDAMYAGRKAALRPVYERLLEIGRELGPDVREIACKTYVSLKRTHAFLQIKPTTATRIDLGLALPETTAAILIPTGGLEKGDRISYRIPLSSVSDINRDVESWMKEAYTQTR